MLFYFGCKTWYLWDTFMMYEKSWVCSRVFSQPWPFAMSVSMCCYERFNVLLWAFQCVAMGHSSFYSYFTHTLLIPCSYLAHVALMSLSCRSLYALYTNYTILLAWPIYSWICKPRHSVRMVRMCFIKQELEQEKTRCMSTGTFRFRDQMIKKPWLLSFYILYKYYIILHASYLSLFLHFCWFTRKYDFNIFFPVFNIQRWRIVADIFFNHKGFVTFMVIFRDFGLAWLTFWGEEDIKD